MPWERVQNRMAAHLDGRHAILATDRRHSQTPSPRAASASCPQSGEFLGHAEPGCGASIEYLSAISVRAKLGVTAEVCVRTELGGTTELGGNRKASQGEGCQAACRTAEREG